MRFEARDLIGYEWLGLLAVWLIAAIGMKRQVRKQAISARMPYVLTLALAIVLIFARSATWGFLRWRWIEDGPMADYLGLILTSTGIAFAIWARFFLGRNWSSTPGVAEGHQLIRRGPYALVRHPIYSGILLGLLGTAVAKGRLGPLIGVLIAGVSFYWKLKTEEQFMTEQFGTEYTLYRREVRALIPFVL
jgi:protein-S-isoprenylcysteine O-methyltransferase Ste14